MSTTEGEKQMISAWRNEYLLNLSYWKIRHCLEWLPVATDISDSMRKIWFWANSWR